MNDLDRSFAVNRFWPIIYLLGLLIVILIFAVMFLGFGGVSLMSLAMEFPRRIGESVMSFFAAVMCGGVLLYLCAFFGSLFRTLRLSDPALKISSEGFRYLFASDDLIPWTAIKDIHIDWHWGIDVQIRFQIDSGFADTLRWRSRIANSFKPEYITVIFRFIKASTAEVEEALLRQLQSKSVQASTDVLSRADELLARNYGALAAYSRRNA
ncbi:hypothetical protein [Bradyrhizobium sp. 6(2017)]|uniref:hypothetical protein n=1 Tax=Bradyrhizobium sp. 6(2017) TaxID=1197460 RepID=UPI0013E1A001|nr:hypothetical protein [Bradyrhizobium sp. 6(2017)]QIG94243.1 hypothetical protein G6P99_18365 [Bradyrhizobium sp. 6(2017)]